MGKGPVNLQTGKSGQFDLSDSGVVLYSRARTGRFPSDEELARLFGGHIGRASG